MGDGSPTAAHLAGVDGGGGARLRSQGESVLSLKGREAELVRRHALFSDRFEQKETPHARRGMATALRSALCALVAAQASCGGASGRTASLYLSTQAASAYAPSSHQPPSTPSHGMASKMNSPPGSGPASRVGSPTGRRPQSSLLQRVDSAPYSLEKVRSRVGSPTPSTACVSPVRSPVKVTSRPPPPIPREEAAAPPPTPFTASLSDAVGALLFERRAIGVEEGGSDDSGGSEGSPTHSVQGGVYLGTPRVPLPLSGMPGMVVVGGGGNTPFSQSRQASGGARTPQSSSRVLAAAAEPRALFMEPLAPSPKRPGGGGGRV